MHAKESTLLPKRNSLEVIPDSQDYESTQHFARNNVAILGPRREYH